jgi:hypothetical protein
MTIAYRDGDAGPEGLELLGEELHFDHLSVVIGEQRTDWPLGVAPESSSMSTVYGMSDTLSLDWSPRALPSSASVTVTLTDGEDEDEKEQRGPSDIYWEGPLAFEGEPTGDGRYLMPGQISHRELPLPLMAQFMTKDGHEEARIAGRIDEIWWQDSPDKEGVAEIWGRGPFDTGEDGQEAARLADENILIGVSIDFAPTERYLLDPETYEPIDTENLDLFDLLMGGAEIITGFAGKIMGATLVPFPAFEESRIETVTASGRGRVIRPGTLLAGAGPLKPPREWFEDPRLTELTPLKIDASGRVYGHLADWDGCHTGFQGICVPPFRSSSGYAYFNVGEIETAEGELVSCGKLMFCREGNGHAPLHMGAEEASRYYDDSTKVGAFVRAGSDRFGTWLAGALRSDVTDLEIQHLRTHPPSGDWRPVKGGPSELVAAFSVPIPGFPIPRALVASLDGDDYAIITAPLSVDGPKRRIRRMAILREKMGQLLYRGGEVNRAERRRIGLEFEDGGMLAYTPEQRRRMAKTGEALPDGSFPIANCADAERAIRAQGRAKDQDRAVAHIRKRVRTLNCSGDIFEDYK